MESTSQPQTTARRQSARQREEYRVLASLLTQRRRAHMSQTQLARTLGRDQAWVAKIEGGRRRTDLFELIQILDVLGVDPSDFINELRRALHRKGE